MESQNEVLFLSLSIYLDERGGLEVSPVGQKSVFLEQGLFVLGVEKALSQQGLLHEFLETIIVGLEVAHVDGVFVEGLEQNVVDDTHQALDFEFWVFLLQNADVELVSLVNSPSTPLFHDCRCSFLSPCSGIRTESAGF